ncbi:MAG: class I SAM-dependent methyltransferase [Gemmatimonadetes bacterium]|nr:class I SAM-dependent methyltransferase [Gemmatimonadota bacterium]
MPTNREVIDLQRGHDIVPTEDFVSVEQYCVYLMHLKAYEVASELAHGATVLDCGCNNGYGTAHLSSVAKRVVGVDVSDRAIEEAQSRHGGENRDFRVVDGLTLPFEDDSFDLSVSFQVIEHVGDYGPYLSEIRRVLTPAGIALFTTPNRLVRLDAGMKPWNSFHVREFSAAELRELLEGVFEQVTVKGLIETVPPPSVYSAELGRVTRVKKENQRWAGIRPKLRGAFPFLGRLGRMLRGRRHSAGLSVEERAAYSTDQVHYSEEDLGRAVDLMAICKG